MENIKTRIENTIYNLGIYPHLKGFNMLARAIEMYYESDGTRDISSMNIYSDIALEMRQSLYVINPSKKAPTYTAVERNIRTAIKQSLADHDGDEMREQIFKDKNLDHCTNTRFITSVAMYLRQQDREDE